MDDGEMLTTPEAAKYLGISVSTIRRLPIPFYRVGKDRRYKRIEIDLYLAQRRVEGPAIPYRP